MQEMTTLQSNIYLASPDRKKSVQFNEKGIK